MVNQMTISLRSYGPEPANAQVATMNQRPPGSGRKYSETSAATGLTLTGVFSTVFGVVDRSVTAGLTDAYGLQA